MLEKLNIDALRVYGNEKILINQYKIFALNKTTALLQYM